MSESTTSGIGESGQALYQFEKAVSEGKIGRILQEADLMRNVGRLANYATYKEQCSETDRLCVVDVSWPAATYLSYAVKPVDSEEEFNNSTNLTTSRSHWRQVTAVPADALEGFEIFARRDA